MGNRPTHRSRRRKLAGVVLVAVSMFAFSVVAAQWALASFLDGGTATSTFSTDTLAPPSALTSNPCLAGTVELSWTATTSSWASGYELRWGTTSGGPYPNSTTTAGTSQLVLGLSLLTNHHFVVRAYHGSWRSPYTPQRTVSC